MTEKKQLLFVCYGLGIGGIEKCLVNLLNVLPEEEYEIDVLLMSPQYALKPQIRRAVHFYDEFQYIIYSGGALEAIRSRGGLARNFGKLLKLLRFRQLEQNGGNGWELFKPLSKPYDIAVAYSQNGYPLYYVIDKVKAGRKILWYHNGAYEADEQEHRKHKAYYPMFDHIVAVSRDCAEVLREKLPFVREKITVLHNFCDAADIRERAKAFVPEGFGPEQTHIVTIGRMSREKGALLALEACRLLREEGRNICWHWVGDGEEAVSVREKAAQLGLEDCFVLEGNQTNPYPFLAGAHLYVQPSYYEAYSTTVTEAKVLCKPMVVTDVGGMRDQLTDGENAWIVPVDARAIADGIGKLLDSEDLRRQFVRNLENCGFSGSRLLEEYQATVFA